MTIRQVEKYIRNSFTREIIKMDKKSNSDHTLDDDLTDNLEEVMTHFKHIPKALYRYRPCREYEFKTLENREIWLSSAEQFLDPYDCRMPMTVRNLSNKKIKKLAVLFAFSKYVYGYNEQQLERYEMALTPDEVRKFYYFNCYDDEMNLVNKKINKFLKKYYVKNEHEKIKQKILLLDKCITEGNRGEEFYKWYKNDEENACKDRINKNRHERMVCCLTESNNNPKMWEEYAENYSGFCVKYDFSKMIIYNWINNKENATVAKSIFPVFYRDKKPKYNIYSKLMQEYKDVLHEYKGEYISPMDMAKLTVQDLTKNSKYSNEQEWRIILFGEKSGPNWFPFSTEIYMGKDISEDNKSKLLGIAEKNNLSVYQQKVELNGFEYELIKKAKPPQVNRSATIYFCRRKIH